MVQSVADIKKKTIHIVKWSISHLSHKKLTNAICCSLYKN